MPDFTHPLLEAYTSLQVICQHQLTPSLNELVLPLLSVEDENRWRRKFQPLTSPLPMNLPTVAELNIEWRQFFNSPQIRLCLYQLQEELGKQNKLDWQALRALWFEVTVS